MREYDLWLIRNEDKLRKRKIWCTFHWEDKGKLLTRPKLCNSFVRAMGDILYTQLSYTTLVDNTPDTGNTARQIAVSTANLRVDAIAGSVARGIVVGTGVGAVAITNYALGTLIAHGNAATQLMYGACTIGVPATAGTSRQFVVTRTFTNSSGGAITVTEVGLYGEGWDGGTSRYFCLERSLTTQLIADTASATGTYTIGVTV